MSSSSVSKLILLLLFCTTPLFAEKTSFLIMENRNILLQEGDITTRHSPCSTFKIPISLIGFNVGILYDAHSPTWNYDDTYDAPFDTWKLPQDPTSWIKNSCVWYSQEITKRLGIKVLNRYLSVFQYGNMDTSGDPDKNNGLSKCWLCSSLQISPMEQGQFLSELTNYTLPVRKKTLDSAKPLFFLETLPNGWDLYGKTGSGFYTAADGSPNRERPLGWFVGWVEKNNRTLVVVMYLENKGALKTYAGPRAKELTREKLIRLLDKSL